MKNKLRSINTKIYSDPWFSELGIEDKLLFIYLLTNGCTNMLGIYEISFKRISFESGLSFESVTKGFERLRKASKGLYKDNHVILFNFLKNQNLNTNMKKSAVQAFNTLPLGIRGQTILEEGNDSKGFERLTQWFESLRKREIEREIEYEEERERGMDTPIFFEAEENLAIQENNLSVAAAPIFEIDMNHPKAMAIFGEHSLSIMSKTVGATVHMFEIFAKGWWLKKIASGGAELYNVVLLKNYLMEDYEKMTKDPAKKSKMDKIVQGMAERGFDLNDLPKDLYI